MAGKLIFENQVTTTQDKTLITKATTAIISALAKNVMENDKREYLLTLAKEINRELRNESVKEYNVFLGEKYEMAIRYEKNSLITFKWKDMRILLLKCPGVPKYSLEEGSEFLVKDTLKLNEKYFFEC